MPLQPGTRLGNYEVLSELGVGGMGEVYKARDLKLGREVALKVLPQGMAADSQRLRRFEQEARAASALNHPNIVTIYEIGEHEGTPYIAMEYVDGLTLRKILAGGPLPNDKLVRYATQMTEGLAKAHQAGIVHRDLKPENMIVSDDGYIKILDFGLAKLLPRGEMGAEVSTLTRETTPGAILGTVGYMSPEQAKGESADFRSDQFSLGAILFEMATGKRAFARESSAQTLTAIIEDDPQPVTLLNPSVPGHLASVIDRCLSKKPSERYESTWDLAKQIHAETLAIPEQPSGRHPLAAAGVGGLLAIILVMIVGLFVSDIREWVTGEGDASRIESIAVLPLENVSGDAEQEYFADGMTEALTTELARIGALKVISRTSAMRYKDSAKSAPEIAKELGVDALIEGSVLTSRGRVRITAQLIDGATDQHLWAQSYEREAEDVLTLQREIALQIAGEVDASLTPTEQERLTREYQVDADSYDAYLRGDYRMFSDTRASAETIVRSLERAIELDPGFAPAYARLADFLSFLSMRGFMDPAESYLDARRLASKAVELDPSLAEARAALARVLFQYEWDWPAAEREFGRALELNRNDAFTLNVYGAFQVLVRADCEEGLSVLERAVELDPFNEFLVFDLGLYAGHCRRYEEAVRHLERVLALRPGLRLAEEFLATWDSFNGSHEKALSRCESLASRLEDDYDSIFLATCGMVNARADRTGEARALLRQLKNPPEGVVVDSSQPASLCAAMGDLDCALDAMEAAYEARASSVVFIRVAPFFDPLRDDPRFQDLLRRMNFPE